MALSESVDLDAISSATIIISWFSETSSLSSSSVIIPAYVKAFLSINSPLKYSKRFFPFVFAVYKALSACLKRSSYFTPPRPKVTPILHEISFSSFLSIRIFSMARRIFSSFLSNFSGFVLSIYTRNSSPPKRPIISLLSSVLFILPATIAITASPYKWPNVSFMFLKLSISRTINAHSSFIFWAFNLSRIFSIAVSLLSTFESGSICAFNFSCSSFFFVSFMFRAQPIYVFVFSDGFNTSLYHSNGSESFIRASIVNSPFTGLPFKDLSSIVSSWNIYVLLSRFFIKFWTGRSNISLSIDDI